VSASEGNPSTADEVARARALYAQRAWDDAYQVLSRADQTAPLGLEDLERLGWSAALSGRDDDLLRILERLYQAGVERGEETRAARWAFWLGLRLFSLGEPGRAGGWIARAQRLTEGKDCVEQGYLLLPMIHRHLATGDLEAAVSAAARAVEIGNRFRERDLSAFASSLQGRALARQGRIADGLALLDEAMVAATAGELSPLVTGLIYCIVIGSCQQVYALDRAREWTAALAEWCQAQPQLVTFTGSCLVHRAEIMQLGGAWQDAIDEAIRAAQRCPQTNDSESAAEAAYQQAEIHRLRGELSAAEEAYRSARQFGREPQPGLALLRLVQGRVDEAASAIRRVVGSTTDRLGRTRLLPALVEIMLAAGEIDEARAGCQELGEIAAQFKTEILSAMAAHARAAVALAEGDARAALDPLHAALRVWQQVGAPYIAARLRVLLARACEALGDHDAAGLERDLARAEFERLGATPDLARVAQPEKAAPGAAHGLTRRELEVLRLLATGKTNKAIAKELFLSEKTVDRHVSNIFTKVNVGSRAAATAYAYEHRLV
jgi:DNA-binding NarL/FixJ family response regulator